LKSNYRSVYTAFDPYPSFKGSSIHIEKMTNVLSNHYGKTLLLSLERQTYRNRNKNIKHLTFKTEKNNFLERGLAYASWVEKLLAQQYQLEIGHFRDIWGGLPILKYPHMTSVFEVNGFPSVELLDRYSAIPSSTLHKFKELENHCLQECDAIICPSETIKHHIINRGINSNKIEIVPNGATPVTFSKKRVSPYGEYIVYFGALQPWQGITILLKAMQYLADMPSLKLVICSSHKEKHSRIYQKIARKLDVAEQIVWKHKTPKEELFQIIHHAKASIVPLTECDRNLEQGCSPLKIFESMACQAPIIASDLPVVREILTPDLDAKLIRAERPAELARAIRLLIDYPDYGKQLATNAHQKFIENYTWEKITKKYNEFYTKSFTFEKITLV